MKGMDYKRFREHAVEFYMTTEGKLSRAEVIKRLESFIVKKQGEGTDFFDKYQVREEKS